MPSAEEAVFLALDEAYLTPGTVTLASLATTGGLGGTRIRVVVLYEQLSRSAICTLKQTGDALGLPLEFVYIPSPEGELPLAAHISRTTYLRLRLADVVPRGRVIYLDTDLVVLQNIWALFKMDLMRQPIGAVRSIWNPVLGRGKGLPDYGRLGLPSGREYFNAGVMVIDMERWGELDIGRRAHRFILEHPEHIAWGDQCALNWVVDDRWVRLPLKWNAFPMSAVERAWYEHDDILPYEQAVQIEESAAVLHFAGALKPWMEDYPVGSARDLYSHYAELANAALGAHLGNCVTATPSDMR
jgi:lipopolysaccharide biosynthesis glycosyltransferase